MAKRAKSTETEDQTKARRRRELEEELTVVPVGRGRPPLLPTRKMIEKVAKHLTLVGTTNATAAARIGIALSVFQEWLSIGRKTLRERGLARLLALENRVPAPPPERNIYADFADAADAAKETRRLRAEQQLAAHFPKHPSALQWWMERTYRERFRPPKVDLILSKETAAAGAALLEEFRDDPAIQERVLRALAREVGAGGAEPAPSGPGGDDSSEGG